jgi:hypothetical protein
MRREDQKERFQCVGAIAVEINTLVSISEGIDTHANDESLYLFLHG